MQILIMSLAGGGCVDFEDTQVAIKLINQTTLTNEIAREFYTTWNEFQECVTNQDKFDSWWDYVRPRYYYVNHTLENQIINKER